MSRYILLVHGRSLKPRKGALTGLWREAIRHGLERDCGPAELRVFDGCRLELVYYGDLSNDFLLPEVDLRHQRERRRATLDDLKRYTADDFNRRNYRKLPGRDALKEAVADVFGDVAALTRLAFPLIGRVAPDLRHYWTDSEFGSDVRHRMIRPLKRAMNTSRDILLVSHSLGCIVAYDTLWKFSRTGEYRPRYTNRRVAKWVTLGCPLGDETVKRELKGRRADGDWRYPGNIDEWVNLAAEDDYISHDGTVAGDFKAMRDRGLVRDIRDYRVYNLAVSEGKSNPHASLGYLVHPVFTRELAAWLRRNQ